jgi:uncharacterized protein (DUF2147 family)
MKILFLSLLISFLTPSNDFTGIWSMSKGNTKIEIYEKSGAYFGKIVSSDDEKAKKGTLVLREFTYMDGVWKGKLYSFKKNKLVDAEMLIEDNILKVSFDAGFMSRTLEWEKE